MQINYWPTYSIFLFSVMTFHVAISQSEPKIDSEIPDYFFAEDVLFGDTVYLFACKKIEEKGLQRIVFDLYKGDIKKSFKMTSVQPSSSSIPIFQRKLKEALKKHEAEKDQVITNDEKVQIKTISDRVGQEGTGLTIEEKDFIDKLVRRTATKRIYKSSLFEMEFEALKTKLEEKSQEESIDFLKMKIEAANIVSITTKEVAQEQLNIRASEFLFRVYVASIDGLNEAPEVGQLYVNNKVQIFPYSSRFPFGIGAQEKIRRKNTLNQFDSLTISKVEIEFEYEQIAGIKVTGTLQKRSTKPIEKTRIRITKTEGKKRITKRSNLSYKTEGVAQEVVFQNRIPISYSTKADVSNVNIDPIRKIKLLPTSIINGMEFPVYILMGEVFKNDYRLLNKTENYSPADQVITIKPGEKGKVIKKEKVVNILKAKVFSDFVGLDSNAPNGLLQTEVSHRFYFNAKVHPVFRTYNYFGFFNSAMPKVIVSKLESNNRVLELDVSPPLMRDNMNMTTKDTLRAFASTIDLYNHTIWSAGGELNFMYIGLPVVHSVIYFNFGGYIRRTSMKLPEVTVTDETFFENFVNIELNENREFGINVVNLYPEITWSAHPHPNFRAALNAKYITLLHFKKDFDVVSDRREYFKTRAPDDLRIWSIKFLAALRIGQDANGELFFRSYFNFIPSNPEQNFFQAQLGYAFNIFDRKNNPAPPKPLEEL